MKYNLLLLSLLLAFCLIFCDEEAKTPEAEPEANSNEETEEINEEQPEEPEIDLKNPNIITLDNSNFTEFIEKNKPIVVLFYAPWCGHCQAFAPEYSKLADKLVEEKSTLKVAKIDAIANEDTGKAQKIMGFPTIRFFYENTTFDYNHGDRTIEAILKYYNKKVNGGYKELKTVKEVEEYTEKEPFVLLATNKEKLNIFTEATKQIENAEFAFCGEKECVDKYKSDIVFIKKVEEPILAFPSDKEITVEALQIFINSNNFELGGDFNPQSADVFFSNKRPALFYFRDNSTAEHTEKDKLMKTIAKEFRDKMYVFVLDIKGNEIYEQTAEYFFVEELPRIQIVSIKEEDINNYIMDEVKTVNDITEEAIKKFVNEFFEGKRERELKSEPVTEQQDPDITLVVGRTFKKMVLDNKKSVMMLYVGKGCEESCEEAMSIWRLLSVKYKDNEEVEYLVMDLTYNEVKGLEKPAAYPVIMGYIKKDKPDTYAGELKLIEIENWMATKLGWADETKKEEPKKEEEKKEEPKKEEKVEDL